MSQQETLNRIPTVSSIKAITASSNVSEFSGLKSTFPNISSFSIIDAGSNYTTSNLSTFSSAVVKTLSVTSAVLAPVAAAMLTAPLLAKFSGKMAITDSGSNYTNAILTTLSANSTKITSLSVDSSTVFASVGALLLTEPILSKFTSTIVVSDAGSNYTAAILSTFSTNSSKVTSVTVTGTVSASVGSALLSEPLLSKLVWTSRSIVDTAENIVANRAKLSTASLIEVDNKTANNTAFMVSQFMLLSADLISKLSSTTRVFTDGSAVTLSVAQYVSASQKLGLLTSVSIRIEDTAENISLSTVISDLDSFNVNNKTSTNNTAFTYSQFVRLAPSIIEKLSDVTTIVSDATTLTLTARQYAKSNNGFGSYVRGIAVVRDSAANIVLNKAALATASSVTSSDDFTAALFAQIPETLVAKLVSPKITDTAENIVNYKNEITLATSVTSTTSFTASDFSSLNIASLKLNFPTITDTSPKIVEFKDSISTASSITATSSFTYAQFVQLPTALLLKLSNFTTLSSDGTILQLTVSQYEAATKTTNELGSSVKTQAVISDAAANIVANVLSSNTKISNAISVISTAFTYTQFAKLSPELILKLYTGTTIVNDGTSFVLTANQFAAAASISGLSTYLSGIASVIDTAANIVANSVVSSAKSITLSESETLTVTQLKGLSDTFISKLSASTTVVADESPFTLNASQFFNAVAKEGALKSSVTFVAAVSDTAANIFTKRASLSTATAVTATDPFLASDYASMATSVKLTSPTIYDTAANIVAYNTGLVTATRVTASDAFTIEQYVLLDATVISVLAASTVVVAGTPFVLTAHQFYNSVLNSIAIPPASVNDTAENLVRYKTNLAGASSIVVNDGTLTQAKFLKLSNVAAKLDDGTTILSEGTLYTMEPPTSAIIDGYIGKTDGSDNYLFSGNQISVSGLEDGKPYTFHVSAVGVFGDVNVTTVSVIPLPFSNLDVTQSGHELNFTWDGTMPSYSITDSSNVVLATTSVNSNTASYTLAGANKRWVSKTFTLTVQFPYAPYVTTFPAVTIMPFYVNRYVVKAMPTGRTGELNITASMDPTEATDVALDTQAPFSLSVDGADKTTFSTPLLLQGLDDFQQYSFTLWSTGARGFSQTSQAVAAPCPSYAIGTTVREVTSGLVDGKTYTFQMSTVSRTGFVSNPVSKTIKVLPVSGLTVTRTETHLQFAWQGDLSIASVLLNGVTLATGSGSSMSVETSTAWIKTTKTFSLSGRKTATSGVFETTFSPFYIKTVAVPLPGVTLSTGNTDTIDVAITNDTADNDAFTYSVVWNGTTIPLTPRTSKHSTIVTAVYSITGLTDGSPVSVAVTAIGSLVSKTFTETATPYSDSMTNRQVTPGKGGLVFSWLRPILSAAIKDGSTILIQGTNVSQLIYPLTDVSLVGVSKTYSLTGVYSNSYAASTLNFPEITIESFDVPTPTLSYVQGNNYQVVLSIGTVESGSVVQFEYQLSYTPNSNGKKPTVINLPPSTTSYVLSNISSSGDCVVTLSCVGTTYGGSKSTSVTVNVNPLFDLVVDTDSYKTTLFSFKMLGSVTTSGFEIPRVAPDPVEPSTFSVTSVDLPDLVIEHTLTDETVAIAKTYVSSTTNSNGTKTHVYQYTCSFGGNILTDNIQGNVVEFVLSGTFNGLQFSQTFPLYTVPWYVVPTPTFTLEASAQNTMTIHFTTVITESMDSFNYSILQPSAHTLPGNTTTYVMNVSDWTPFYFRVRAVGTTYGVRSSTAQQFYTNEPLRNLTITQRTIQNSQLNEESYLDFSWEGNIPSYRITEYVIDETREFGSYDPYSDLVGEVVYRANSFTIKVGGRGYSYLDFEPHSYFFVYTQSTSDDYRKAFPDNFSAKPYLLPLLSITSELTAKWGLTYPSPEDDAYLYDTYTMTFSGLPPSSDIVYSTTLGFNNYVHFYEIYGNETFESLATKPDFQVAQSDSSGNVSFDSTIPASLLFPAKQLSYSITQRVEGSGFARSFSGGTIYAIIDVSQQSDTIVLTFPSCDYVIQDSVGNILASGNGSTIRLQIEDAWIGTTQTFNVVSGITIPCSIEVGAGQVPVPYCTVSATGDSGEILFEFSPQTGTFDTFHYEVTYGTETPYVAHENFTMSGLVDGTLYEFTVVCVGSFGMRRSFTTRTMTPHPLGTNFANLQLSGERTPPSPFTFNAAAMQIKFTFNEPLYYCSLSVAGETLATDGSGSFISYTLSKKDKIWLNEESFQFIVDFTITYKIHETSVVSYMILPGNSVNFNIFGVQDHTIIPVRNGDFTDFHFVYEEQPFFERILFQPALGYYIHLESEGDLVIKDSPVPQTEMLNYGYHISDCSVFGIPFTLNVIGVYSNPSPLPDEDPSLRMFSNVASLTVTPWPVNDLLLTQTNDVLEFTWDDETWGSRFISATVSTQTGQQLSQGTASGLKFSAIPFVGTTATFLLAFVVDDGLRNNINPVVTYTANFPQAILSYSGANAALEQRGANLYFSWDGASDSTVTLGVEVVGSSNSTTCVVPIHPSWVNTTQEFTLQTSAVAVKLTIAIVPFAVPTPQVSVRVGTSGQVTFDFAVVSGTFDEFHYTVNDAVVEAASYTISNLNDDQAYEFEISAVGITYKDSDYEVKQSFSLNATPRNVTAVSVSQIKNELFFSWSGHSGTITYADEDVASGVNDATCLVSNDWIGETITFRVNAVSFEPFLVKAYTVPEPTATYTTGESGSVTLSVTYPENAFYDAYTIQVLSGETVLALSSVDTFTITGLTDGLQYDTTVKIIGDSFGTIETTTLSFTPYPISGLAVSQPLVVDNVSKLKFSWIGVLQTCAIHDADDNVLVSGSNTNELFYEIQSTDDATYYLKGQHSEDSTPFSIVVPNGQVNAFAVPTPLYTLDSFNGIVVLNILVA